MRSDNLRMIARNDCDTSPITGTLSLAYSTEFGSTDTVLKVLVNGAVVETVTLTAAAGVAALTAAVAAGDIITVEVEHDAGTEPRDGIYQVYVEEA